jgi:hypothetical protein
MPNRLVSSTGVDTVASTPFGTIASVLEVYWNALYTTTSFVTVWA